MSIVDLAQMEVARAFDLEPHAEPGFIAFAGDRGYVVLRRRGTVAVIDLQSFVMFAQPVCPAPRGIAHDTDFSEGAAPARP
jgi:hypothetical protein